MVDKPEFQDYEYIRFLPPALIAWEYLRRNPAYRLDWARAQRPRRRVLGDGIVLIEAPGPSPAAEAWELEVFFRSGRERPGRAGLLAPAEPARRSRRPRRPAR